MLILPFRTNFAWLHFVQKFSHPSDVKLFSFDMLVVLVDAKCWVEGQVTRRQSWETTQW